MSVTSKIQKLLAQSKSDNVNEAAVALGLAQELMAKHKIELADLEIETGSKHVYEPVADVEEVLEGTDTKRSQVRRWRTRLARVVAQAFNCDTYYTFETNHIAILGRKSDMEASRYIFTYLTQEIDRLCEAAWKKLKTESSYEYEMPRPRVWKNSFREGAVHTIRERFEPQTEVRGARPKATYEAASEAPIVPQSAAMVLVREDEKRAQAEFAQKWAMLTQRLKLRAPKWQPTKHSNNAYAEGQKAGGSVTLGPGRGALDAPKKRVEG